MFDYTPHATLVLFFNSIKDNTMARIEIKGTPEELERIVIFLKANNIQFHISPDFGNHSKENLEKYEALMQQYNTEGELNGIGHD